MSWKHLRGAIVERVEHPITHRKSNLRLDRRSMWFFAREDESDPRAEPFAAKDGDKVRAWLLEQLSRTSAAEALEWQPVIEIEHGGDSHHYFRDDSKQEHSESLSVKAKRYWIALTHDQREWRKLKWEEADEESSTCIAAPDRYSASSKYADGPKADSAGTYASHRIFRLPSFDEKHDGSKVVIAFTPEIWLALQQICGHLKAMRQTLGELVGTKKGVAVLAEIGSGKSQLLLGPPKQRSR